MTDTGSVSIGETSLEYTNINVAVQTLFNSGFYYIYDQNRCVQFEFACQNYKQVIFYNKNLTNRTLLL